LLLERLMGMEIWGRAGASRAVSEESTTGMENFHEGHEGARRFSSRVSTYTVSFRQWRANRGEEGSTAKNLERHDERRSPVALCVRGGEKRQAWMVSPQGARRTQRARRLSGRW